MTMILPCLIAPAGLHQWSDDEDNDPYCMACGARLSELEVIG